MVLGFYHGSNPVIGAVRRRSLLLPTSEGRDEGAGKRFKSLTADCVGNQTRTVGALTNRGSILAPPQITLLISLLPLRLRQLPPQSL